MKTLIKDAILVTMNEQNEVIERGTIGFSESEILYVGENPPDDLTTYDDILDGKNKLVLPGLVNTHGHAGMSLLRGFADDLPLQEWLEQKMWPKEAQFTPEHVKWGSQLAAVEMIKSGTTTFVDMYDHMDETAKTVEESGMRGVLARGVIGLVSENEREKKLEEAARFASDWNGRANQRITTMMSPHAPYTCPPEYIEQIVEKAADLQLPVHIHMSETAREVQQNVDDYGTRPVEHLHRIGVFDHPTLVAHAVHITDEEMDILAEKDVKISHNPVSNLKLASGVAPVPTMLDKGLGVSLGTDSVASNNNLDLFEEIRLAAMLHKGMTYDATAIPAVEALKMATCQGAKAVFLNSPVGALKTGYKSDIITVSTDSPHFYPRTDWISHLVYSANGQDVQDVFVDGHSLMRNRIVQTLDEERICYEADRMFQALK